MNHKEDEIMKNIKKLLAVILSIVMVAVIFVACSGKKTDNASTAPAEGENAAAVDSDLAYVKDKGSLVIGITIFEPMDYYDENNELTGFEVEFGKAVCEKLGVPMSMLPTPVESSQI